MHADRNKGYQCGQEYGHECRQNVDMNVDMNVNFSGSENSQEALQLIQQNSRKMYLHDPLMPDS